jgi:uncharacterized phage infection (PIP) family protein YhgE
MQESEKKRFSALAPIAGIAAGLGAGAALFRHQARELFRSARDPLSDLHQQQRHADWQISMDREMRAAGQSDSRAPRLDPNHLEIKARKQNYEQFLDEVAEIESRAHKIHLKSLKNNTRYQSLKETHSALEEILSQPSGKIKSALLQNHQGKTQLQVTSTHLSEIEEQLNHDLAELGVKTSFEANEKTLLLHDVKLPEHILLKDLEEAGRKEIYSHQLDDLFHAPGGGASEWAAKLKTNLQEQIQQAETLHPEALAKEASHQWTLKNMPASSKLTIFAGAALAGVVVGKLVHALLPSRRADLAFASHQDRLSREHSDSETIFHQGR